MNGALRTTLTAPPPAAMAHHALPASSRNRCRTNARAFTIAEVLAALAIIVALLLAMFTITGEVTSWRARILVHTNELRESSALFDRLEGELLCAEATRGVTGTESSITIRRYGIDPAAPATTPLLGLPLETTYRFDAASSSVLAQRTSPDALWQPDSEEPAGNTNTLDESSEPTPEDDQRSASSTDSPGDNETNEPNVGSEAVGSTPNGSAADDFEALLGDEEGDVQPALNEWGTLLSNVARLRIRYHNGRGWRTTFQPSASMPLPKAVELALWFTSTAPTPQNDDASVISNASSRLQDPAQPFDSVLEQPVDSRLTGLADDQPEVNPDRVRIIALTARSLRLNETTDPAESSFEASGTATEREAPINE